FLSFFFQCFVDLPNLHSFPTRRSSDLLVRLFHVLDARPRSIILRFCGPLNWSTLLSGLRGLRNVGLFGAWRRQVRVLSRGHACRDRKSTRLNSSHVAISYAVFCLKKKN